METPGKTEKRFRIGIDCRMYGARFTGIGIYVQKLVEYLGKNDHDTEYVLFLSKEGFETCPLVAPNFRKILVDAPHYSWKEQCIFPFILWRE